MENDEIRKMIDECSEMVNELRNYNLETWATQREVMLLICQAADTRSLKVVHEDLKVRLMAVRN